MTSGVREYREPSARSASQIDDLATAGADDPLDNPPVDFGEERVPGERFERESLFVSLRVNPHRTSRVLLRVPASQHAPAHAAWIVPKCPRYTVRARFAPDPRYYEN